MAFYVTVRNGKRVGWLVGPCATHEEALSFVERTRQIANQVDPFTVFYEFGTASADLRIPGMLNARVGFTPEVSSNEL